MRDGRLNDAAIALSKALREGGVNFGIFGGFAVRVHGGPRETKDIDCVIHCQKEWIVDHLNSRKDFSYMGNTRPDCAIFVWGSDKPGGGVLIELFPTSMDRMTHQQFTVQGEILGANTTEILDVGFIYKGKLKAAATRGKHSDAADLVFIESRYSAFLKTRTAEFSPTFVGLALKRFPHLEHGFLRLGLDVNAAKKLVEYVQIDTPTPPQPNDVQNGLLFGL